MENGKKSCCSSNCSCCSNLSVCNLGMSLGIVWGLSMLLCGMLSMMWGVATPFVDLFSSIYIGFDSTIVGSVMGLIWGFIDGFILGALIAYLYNFCSCRCPCAYCKKNRND